MHRLVQALCPHSRDNVRRVDNHHTHSANRGGLHLLLVVLLACVGMVHAGGPDPIVFQSSSPGATGGGLSISSESIGGHTFRITERVRVSSVGSQFRAFANGSIFAALYKLHTPISTPEAVNDSTLIATTLLDIPGGQVVVEVSGDMDVVLDPGWYSLVFGTGRHGATAAAASVIMVPTGTGTVANSYGPYSVNLSTGSMTLQGMALRVVVRGQLLGAPPVQPNDFVFETVRPWAWWGSGIMPIYGATLIGQRFTLTRPTRIGRASTWTWGSGDGSLFAAVFPIADAEAFPPDPSSPDFESQALASTLITPQSVSDEYHGDFNDVLLPAGHYALVFGSGRFGADGHFHVQTVADGFVAPGALRYQPPNIPNWLFSTSGTFSMRLTGTMPDVALADDAVDFADVLVEAVEQRTATLINLRDLDALTITGMHLLGDDAEQFAVAGDATDCISIAAGATCSFTVEYRPQQAGPHHASLSIESNGSPSPLVLDLHGNGLASAWVTPSAGPHGHIQPDVPQLVGVGDTVEFELSHDIGYHVDAVDGSCGGDAVGTLFTTDAITADCTVEARFAINLYTLNYEADAHGTIDGDSPQSVAHGGDGTPVSALPDSGYHFTQWSDGRTDNPRTDANVTGPISVHAQFAINTFTLHYDVVAHGSINGDNPQTVPYGGNGTAVTAVADTGYHFVRWSDNSIDNPRTDINVMTDISVDAEFELNTYTVTSSAGEHGSISPEQTQTVDHGDVVTFQVVANEGYVATVAGSCGGELVGATYTTSPIVGHCTVVASFVAPITLQIVGGDAQSAPLGAAFAQPMIVMAVDPHGAGVPNANIRFEAPTTGPSTSPNLVVLQADGNGQARYHASANMQAGSYAVTVSAPAFSTTSPVAFGLSNHLPIAALIPSIDSGRDFARYGQVIYYMVQVENNGPDHVIGLDIDVQLSDSLNVVSATWECVTPATGCTATGTGAPSDSGLSLPVGQEVLYILSVPVFTAPSQHLIRADLDIHAPGISESAFDTSTLVIMRNGFNAAQDDGAQHSPWQPSDADADAMPADTADLIDGDVLALPDLPLPGNGIATLWRTPAGAKPSLRVDRLQHGDNAYLRIVAADTRGEHASAWISHARGAAALLSRHDTVDGTGVMLSSGDHSTDVLLMHDVDDPP